MCRVCSKNDCQAGSKKNPWALSKETTEWAWRIASAELAGRIFPLKMSLPASMSATRMICAKKSAHWRADGSVGGTSVDEPVRLPAGGGDARMVCVLSLLTYE